MSLRIFPPAISIVLLHCFALHSATVAEEVLYGITSKELLVINPSDPSDVTVVGPTLVPSNLFPFSLTHDKKNDRLVGLAWEMLESLRSASPGRLNEYRTLVRR